ncbi:MAG: outer membrane protein transport protein [Kiritimatiellales bacterium]
MKNSKKNGRVWLVAGVVVTGLVLQANATNGDILEGIGAVSGGMGGTGVAAPQDGISAIVNNPAGLSFLPGSELHEVNIGITFFRPHVRARLRTPAGTYSGGSDDPTSYIPYMSYTQPLNERWAAGFAAYGISGMGVDYKKRPWDLDGDPSNGYEGAVYTKFASMKFAPALSYKITDSLSIGISPHFNYSTLSIGQGEVDDVSFGGSIGLLQRIGDWNLGLSYTSPQKARFKGVYNFDEFLGDTRKDTLVLEQPAVYGAGAAWEPNDQWLIAFDIKRLMWGEADGYGDFDWENQWVYAVGARYRLTSSWDLRAGFNYSRNPVKEHRGWDPMGMTSVQGKYVPTMGYELLRTVAFPAIVETHITLGAGYHINENLLLNVAYMHAFEKHSSSSGSTPGGDYNFKSSLYEDSLTIGLTWLF